MLIDAKVIEEIRGWTDADIVRVSITAQNKRYDSFTAILAARDDLRECARQ